MKSTTVSVGHCGILIATIAASTATYARAESKLVISTVGLNEEAGIKQAFRRFVERPLKEKAEIIPWSKVRARAQAQNPVGWRLAVGDSTTAIAAESTIALVARIASPFHLAWASGDELERILANRHGEPEGAARNSLTVGAMTGIDHQWRSHDSISKRAALAATVDG